MQSFSPIHTRKYDVPFTSWIGIADSTALIGGSSPLLRGMTVIALGSAYVNGGTNPTVNVPPGWTNRAFAVFADDPDRYAIGIWTKKLVDEETPNFFTTHDQAQMHYYGYWDDSGPDPFSVYPIPTIDKWFLVSDGNPASELGNLSGIGSKPFIIAGLFRSTGAVSGETISLAIAEVYEFTATTADAIAFGYDHLGAT